MIEECQEVLSLSQSSASLYKPNMMRNIVAGNWKSNKSINESREWMNEMRELESELPSDVRVMVAPPTPYLAALAESKPSYVTLASQNVCATNTGAYTGEYTAEMLVSCGVSFALIGHSERREYYGDSDSVVVEKISRCVEAGLGVVLCCGEQLEIRKAGTHEEMISAQLNYALNGITDVDPLNFVIAYEPIWAIGSSRSATMEQIEYALSEIRKVLRDVDTNFYEPTKILYGGSVTEENIAEILGIDGVDGALIGGASLDSKSFSTICRIAKTI